MQIESKFIEPSVFYHELRKIVSERIEELIKECQAYESIDRDRGLFGYEKRRRNASGYALKTNEDFMILFDPDYLRFQ